MVDQVSLLLLLLLPSLAAAGGCSYTMVVRMHLSQTFRGYPPSECILSGGLFTSLDTSSELSFLIPWCICLRKRRLGNVAGLDLPRSTANRNEFFSSWGWIKDDPPPTLGGRTQQ